jgi:hypothetical protein
VVPFADGEVYVPPAPRGWWERVLPFSYSAREEEAWREFMRERGRRIWAGGYAPLEQEYQRRLGIWEAQARNARGAVRRRRSLPLRRASRRYVP